MFKRIVFAILISIILILTGCQSEEDKNELRIDAENVYLSIKNEILSGESMSDYQKEQVNDFKDKYINNFDKYKDEEKLLSDMEKLIFGYEFYYVAIGQNDEETVKKKQDEINDALLSLDKQFNK